MPYLLLPRLSSTGASQAGTGRTTWTGTAYLMCIKASAASAAGAVTSVFMYSPELIRLGPVTSLPMTPPLDGRLPSREPPPVRLFGALGSPLPELDGSLPPTNNLCFWVGVKVRLGTDGDRSGVQYQDGAGHFSTVNTQSRLIEHYRA